MDGFFVNTVIKKGSFKIRRLSWLVEKLLHSQGRGIKISAVITNDFAAYINLRYYRI
jgi:hypothetical protein